MACVTYWMNRFFSKSYVQTLNWSQFLMVRLSYVISKTHLNAGCFFSPMCPKNILYALAWPTFLWLLATLMNSHTLLLYLFQRLPKLGGEPAIFWFPFIFSSNNSFLDNLDHAPTPPPLFYSTFSNDS